MTDSTGFGETSAQSAIQNVTSGGVTVHLCSSAPSYSDGASGITSVSEASTNVAETDVTVNNATGFADTATLTNDNEISFGSQSVGTITHIVIQNQNDGATWILADETNDPDLTGEDVTLPADTTLYEFGNP